MFCMLFLYQSMNCWKDGYQSSSTVYSTSDIYVLLRKNCCLWNDWNISQTYLTASTLVRFCSINPSSISLLLDDHHCKTVYSVTWSDIPSSIQGTGLLRSRTFQAFKITSVTECVVLESTTQLLSGPYSLKVGAWSKVAELLLRFSIIQRCTENLGFTQINTICTEVFQKTQ